MTSLKSKNLSVLLGLALEERRIEGAIVRRSGGNLKIEKSFVAPMSLDLLANEPELVGHEIRKCLNDAGVREKRCAVAVPLNWAMSLQTKLPQIAGDDLKSFIEVQAERGFPFPPSELAIGVSRFRITERDPEATLVAIPRGHLARLQQALTAAQLKPVSFTIGIAALAETVPGHEPGAGMFLIVDENKVDLQVTGAGGVLALRVLKEPFETAGAERTLNLDRIARDIRITLGQLPTDCRASLKSVRIFGRPGWSQTLAQGLEQRLGSLGMRWQAGLESSTIARNGTLGVEGPISPAAAVAVRHLQKKEVAFEFLPPKPKPWTQVALRLSTGRLLWGGGALAVAVVVIGAAFFWQHWKLSKLEKQWAVIAPKVTEIETLQSQIRKFRPWFNETAPGLTILRQLTEAFPEDGVVSAKTFEVRDGTTVLCAGTAQSNQALLKVLDRLRQDRSVADLKLQQVQGNRAPLQFTFNFKWIPGGAGEN